MTYKVTEPAPVVGTTPVVLGEKKKVESEFIIFNNSETESLLIMVTDDPNQSISTTLFSYEIAPRGTRELRPYENGVVSAMRKTGSATVMITKG